MSEHKNSLSTYTQAQASPNISQNFTPETLDINSRAPTATLNYVELEQWYNTYPTLRILADTPVDDAYELGFEITDCEPELSPEDKLAVMGTFNRCIGLQKFGKFVKYSRIYGGSGLLVDNGCDLDKPLEYADISPDTPLSFHVFDRWAIQSTQILGESNKINQDVTINFNRKSTDNEYFYLRVIGSSSRKTHFDRLIVGRQNATLDRPSYQYLRGWGASVYEPVIEVLNRSVKAMNVAYELLDEAKVDFYKIAGFKEDLVTTEGTEAQLKRLLLCNKAKNYNNGVMMDSLDSWEQKTLNFAGLSEMMQQTRIDVAHAAYMPMSKLYGEQQAGWSSKEYELDNYNKHLASTIQQPNTPALKECLKWCMAKAGIEIPEYFDIKYPSMRVLSELEQQQAKTIKFDRLMQMYQAGIDTGKITVEDRLLELL